MNTTAQQLLSAASSVVTILDFVIRYPEMFAIACLFGNVILLRYSARASHSSKDKLQSFDRSSTNTANIMPNRFLQTV